MDIMSMAFEYIVGTNKTLREIVQKKRPEMVEKGKNEIETNSTVQSLLDREKPYEFGPYEYHYLYYYYQVAQQVRTVDAVDPSGDDGYDLQTGSQRKRTQY